MTDTVTLKGIPFTATRWGESDLYHLACPHCHPGVDFKKDEVVEVEGNKYLVYLVGDHSINLQRLHPMERFTGQPNVMTASDNCPTSTEANLRAQLAQLQGQLEAARRWRKAVELHNHLYETAFETEAEIDAAMAVDKAQMALFHALAEAGAGEVGE